MTEHDARLLGADCSSHGAPDKKPVLIFGARPDFWGLLIVCGVCGYAFLAWLGVA